MGQETKGLKLLLLIVKDQVATPGIGSVFLLPLRCWEKEQQCQVEGEEKALI